MSAFCAQHGDLAKDAQTPCKADGDEQDDEQPALFPSHLGKTYAESWDSDPDPPQECQAVC